MVNFSDTATAFSGRSDADIKRGYRLFSMVRIGWLVMVNSVLARVALFFHFPLRWIVKPTIFRQFCGGETAQECASTVAFLWKHRVSTMIDFAAEGKKSEDAFESVINSKTHAMQAFKGNPGVPFSVLKMTGIARMELMEKVSGNVSLAENEKTEWEAVKQRLHRLFAATRDCGMSIMIDAEESWIQDCIDSLVMELMAEFNKARAVVYNTYQFYRWDRLDVLKRHHRAAIDGGFILGVKPVRGAYMEKERLRAKKFNYRSPIHDTKADTDRDFNECLKYCIGNISTIALCSGTHNEESCHYLVRTMEEHHIAKNHPHISCAQLYGMSDHITFNLAHHGYNAAKHVPFGRIREVLPYLMRRAEENSSFSDFSGREVKMLEKEIKRRRADTIT